jgi:hypothetical protein
LHSVTIGLVLRDPRFLVLENGADYFLWVSWLLALVLLAFRRWFDYPMLGAFITSAIVLFMGSSSYLLHQDTTSLIDQVELSSRQGLMVSLLHGVPALVSVVSLVLALAVSLAFLVVERRIKRRTSLALEVGGVSLQLLDRLNTQLVRIGFVAGSNLICAFGAKLVASQNIATYSAGGGLFSPFGVCGASPCGSNNSRFNMVLGLYESRRTTYRDCNSLRPKCAGNRSKLPHTKRRMA